MTHAAGWPSSGLSAAPNVLVVLLKTTPDTRHSSATSSTHKVPVMLVSTNAARECVATCGLWSAAAWITQSTPRTQLRTNSASATEPTCVVKGDSRRSRPTASCWRSRSVRTRPSPRWPALPVTRTRIREAPLCCLTSALGRAALAMTTATAQLAEQLVVLGMGPDPEPNQAVGRLDGKRSMMRTYTGRPEAPDLLDANGCRGSRFA